MDEHVKVTHDREWHAGTPETRAEEGQGKMGNHAIFIKGAGLQQNEK